MRGRALLAGLVWEYMNLRDRIDFAEAVWCEPFVNGAHVGVEEVIDGLADAIAKAYPDRDTWGKAPGQARAMANAEAAFAPGKTSKAAKNAQAEKRTNVERAKRSRSEPKMAPAKGAKPPTVGDQ